MSFGIFEAAVTSEYEVGIAKQAATDKLAAALYDVKEQLGPFLFASATVEEFRDRVAMTKNDQSLFKIIEAHLPPVTGIVRRIAGKNSILEREFKQHLADTNTQAPGTGSSSPVPGGLNTPALPGAAVPTTPVPPAQSQPPAAGSNNLSGTASVRQACYPGCESNEAHSKKFHNKDARRRQADDSGANGFADAQSRAMGQQPPQHTFADPTGGLLGETAQPGVHPQNGMEVSPGGLTPQTRPLGTPPGVPAPGLPKPVASRQAVYDTIDHPKWDNGTLDIAETFEDKQGKELKPKGDWAGYRNKVDQGAPSKIKRNFASKEAVAIYADWCKANQLSPARLSSLDSYATNLAEDDYFKLANVILAWDNDHHPKVPSTDLKKKDKVANSDPMRQYVAWCNANGYKRLSANNINHYARGNPQLAYFLAQRAKQAIKTVRQRQGRRRTAAPDYLQKADDALTQLLNQKAQEFQEVIAPLQQALVTVQQATQLQQQQNPMSVLPTPGTVNVMPGQQQTPAQVGMPDPNAPDMSGLAQMLAQPGGGGQAAGLGAPAGGVQDDQSGPPPAAAGGGLPPDLDPSAQKAARRGKGRGVTTRPRQAAGVGEMWDSWQRQRNQGGELARGGDVDYEQFKNEKGVGDQALTKLKKRNETPDFAPINGQTREPTVGRRQVARWDEEHEYMGTDGNKGTDDFHTYGDGGATAQPDHPGVPHGWKGQFDKDQYAPYTGEYYSKGDAHVRGGPGPEGSKYYLHTPNGRTGPHGTPEEAFQSAAAHLGQQDEMAKGQGAFPLDLGGPNKAAMRDFPKGRKAQTKQAWSGWGPSVHPKVRQVTGWKWDDHLNGYTASRPERFACDCGNGFNTPTGFQRCACGKQWNSYVIGTGGGKHEASADKYLVREIPARHDMIVANRKLSNYEDMPDTSPQPIVGKPADSDYHLDRGNNSAAWALQKEKQHGKPLSQFSDDDWAIAGDPPGKRASVQLIDPRTGAIHDLVEPGELGEGEPSGTPSMKYPPKDWARRGDGAKWQKSPIG
jgi:hypothetical protein